MSTNPNKRKREDEEDQPKTPIGKKLLENFSVADVMPYRKETLITIDPTVSFASALKQLIEHKILAAPLVDKKTGNCSGFVDMVDLVCAVVDVVKSNPEFEDKELEDVVDNEAEMVFEGITAGSVSDYSKRDHFRTVSKKDSLWSVGHLLLTNHRVAVMENEKLVGIVTQSAFLEYLIDSFGDELPHKKRHVRDLTKLPPVVFSIGIEKSAIDAFREIKDKGVSGLAVVDKAGVIVDVISVSDLTMFADWEIGGQHVSFMNFKILNQPIPDFLKESRSQKQHSVKEALEKHPIWQCTKEWTLEHVRSEMVLNNVHRLFVVDDLGKPVSVVSIDVLLADVLK